MPLRVQGSDAMSSRLLALTGLLSMAVIQGAPPNPPPSLLACCWEPPAPQRPSSPAPTKRVAWPGTGLWVLPLTARHHRKRVVPELSCVSGRGGEQRDLGMGCREAALLAAGVLQSLAALGWQWDASLAGSLSAVGSDPWACLWCWALNGEHGRGFLIKTMDGAMLRHSCGGLSACFVFFLSGVRIRPQPLHQDTIDAICCDPGDCSLPDQDRTTTLVCTGPQRPARRGGSAAETRGRTQEMLIKHVLVNHAGSAGDGDGAGRELPEVYEFILQNGKRVREKP